MKYLIVLLVSVASISFGQEKDEYFAMIYTVGPKWDTTIAYNKQPYFEEHSQHLSTLRKSGKIVLGARYSDKGLIILKVKNEKEARTIGEADLSVKNGIFDVVLYPFNVFYEGCVGSTGKH